VHAAAFLSETRIITSGVDKLLIMWEILQEGVVSEISRIETRNYLDIAASGKRFATAG
jgi:energy-converting hydrogenase Eha subunit C